jgi:hypothetical protein
MLGPDGGKSHQHADIAGAYRGRHAVGPDRRHCHPVDVAGSGLLEWLSPAPVGSGGYLARWYEGYLVPSRSTVFGLYLHFGEDSSFWINLGINALATLWILQLTLRVFRMPQPLRLLAISFVLVLTNSLPWLASMLLTDIFAGLSVLALFILVAHGERTSIPEKCLLFGLTAFAAARRAAPAARRSHFARGHDHISRAGQRVHLRRDIWPA